MSHAQTILRSLQLLKVECAVTGMVFAMPILNLFYKNEIGMSLAEVGLSQAAFNAALFALNLFGGWVADRFSRRACNIFGDVLAAVGFLLYANTQTFGHVVGCEILIGIGLAFSGGADTALLHAYSSILNLSYDRITGQIQKWRIFLEIVAVSVGGVIGTANPRLAIALSGATYGIGAILSWFIVDAGDKRDTTAFSWRTIVQALKDAVRDMQKIITYALRTDRELSWHIFAFAFGREMTHPLVWLFTPLLVMAGVPGHIIGIAWALNLIAAWCGVHVANATDARLKDWQQYAIGATVFVVCATGLSISVSIWTIGLYAGFGFARGWMSKLIGPMVQRRTPGSMQSTVTSIASSVSQIIYMPLVWGFGALGDISPQVSVIASLALFAPLLMITSYKLSTFARR